ncbi:MAG: hypothetical protein IAI49_09815 [Candidatus Eremiobacteraeota bacterium]|nr:hypothetical protein [Candidatus Eremiobacteraeota bacterium]
MSQHKSTPSPKPVTYTAKAALGSRTLTCSRCGRVHAYPVDGGRPIRCECGWWYENRGGLIQEHFKPRLGV